MRALAAALVLLAAGCETAPSCDNVTCILDTRLADTDGGFRDGGFCVFHERPVCCNGAPAPLCGSYTDSQNTTYKLAIGTRDGGDCTRVVLQGVGCQ